MAAILNYAILNLAILDSATLVFPLKLTHTCQDWFPPFAQKRLHSHFPPHHLHKKTSLIHSDSTWWWQPSWILPCWIKKLHSFILTQLDDGNHLEFCHVGFRHLVFFSQIHSKTLSLHSDSWLKLIQSDSNLFILTQLDDGGHLEFGHLGFSHLIFFSQTHSHLPGLVATICTKKTTLTIPFPPFAQKILHSFILMQLDDGSHLEFYNVGLKNFTHSFWFNLMMVAILNLAFLDSAILHKTLTQTYSIWLKLIHSDSTWWWQPSWILPCWV